MVLGAHGLDLALGPADHVHSPDRVPDLRREMHESEPPFMIAVHLLHTCGLRVLEHHDRIRKWGALLVDDPAENYAVMGIRRLRHLSRISLKSQGHPNVFA